LESVILCGGYATRMRPISEFIPKALLPIRGKPVLEHTIEDIMPMTERAVISTNDRFSDQFRYWADCVNLKHARQYISLVIEPATTESEKFGILKGAAYAIDKAAIKGDLAILTGDKFRDHSLGDLFRQFEKDKRPTLIVKEQFADKNMDMRMFEEKFIMVKKHGSTMTAGAMVIPSEHVTKISEYVAASGDNDSLIGFLDWLDKIEKIRWMSLPGNCVDIGEYGEYSFIFNKELDKRLNSLKRQ
jgi:NDP-sugar pyrophosphorylase family protein